VEIAEVLNSQENIVYTVEYYSAIKNEIMSFTGKWMELETMLSEINQAQNIKYHMFSLI
jgi:hypothetical protein